MRQIQNENQGKRKLIAIAMDYELYEKLKRYADRMYEGNISQAIRVILRKYLDVFATE